MKKKTNNKLLLIAITLTVIGCHNIYAQNDSICVFSRGELVKNEIIDSVQQFFLSGAPMTSLDTLFIHIPPLYQKDTQGDSIKYIFKDIGDQPIKSGYAYIDKNGVVYLTNLNTWKLFIVHQNGIVIHYYAVRLYFGNSSKYIVLLAMK